MLLRAVIDNQFGVTEMPVADSAKAPEGICDELGNCVRHFGSSPQSTALISLTFRELPPCLNLKLEEATPQATPLHHCRIHRRLATFFQRSVVKSMTHQQASRGLKAKFHPVLLIDPAAARLFIGGHMTK